MASTKEMQLRAKAKKDAAKKEVKTPSYTPTISRSMTYGKLVMEAGRCRIFRANQLGLENYKLATGNLPYEIESAESIGLQLNGTMMKQMFGIGEDPELDLHHWRDYLLVITGDDGAEYAYGFRVDYDNKDKEMTRPAYGDTVSMTAVQVGIARMALTGSHVSSYARQYGEGPNRYVRTSAMSGLTGEEAADWYNAAKIAIDSFNWMNVYRWLD